LAFAVALGLECVPLFRGETPGQTAGWIALALYVFWVIAQFLGGRVRRLRARIEAREDAMPPWLRGVLILAGATLVFVVATNIEILHKEVGLPLGAVLLALALVGWLSRPGILWLYGKRLGPADAPRAVAPTKREQGAARTMGRGQKVVLGLAAVALLILYLTVFRGGRPPRIEGEEAAAAVAEFEELGSEALELHMLFLREADRMQRGGEAESAAVEAIRRRAEQALDVHGKAIAWKLRLEIGRVHARERDRMQQEMEDLREELERVRRNERP
jgi:hypothetical protein